MRKDGNYELYGIGEGDFEEMLASLGKEKKAKYSEVLESPDYEAACAAVQRIDPRSWVNNGDRIRDNLKYTFNPRFGEYLL